MSINLLKAAGDDIVLSEMYFVKAQLNLWKGNLTEVSSILLSMHDASYNFQSKRTKVFACILQCAIHYGE
eukprot:Pgem_evm1s17305